jgi:hypothetical protein
MSKAEMKRICRDQLKQQKQTGAPAEPQRADGQGQDLKTLFARRLTAWRSAR